MTPPRNGRPRLAPVAGRGGPTPTRTIGVILVDLTPHVDRRLLFTSRPDIFIPMCGYAPGSNIEIHIGTARYIRPDDPTLYEIARASHGCAVVVKGHDPDGVREALRVLDRMRGFAPAPERHGCDAGGCELLYGSPDLERNDT